MIQIHGGVAENMTCAMFGVPFGAFQKNDDANFFRHKAMWEVIRIESLDVVSVPDGVEKGYIVGSTFYKAGDENTEVSAVDITKQKKLYVVCVKGSAKIQTDGQVRYVSEGVTLNGSMAETPEGETSYIIFK